MPVPTFLMSDIHRSPPKAPTPTQQHRENVGRGTYNRYGLLGSSQKGGGTRSTSQKRPLSDDPYQESPGKIPKLDANKIFDQLKVYDTLMNVAKNTLTEVGSCAAKVGNVDDGGIGTVIFKLSQVIDAIINSQEAIKSTIVDFVKLGNNTNQKSGKTPLGSEERGGQRGNPPAGDGKSKKPAPNPAEVERAKVKKVLREAERRIIAFDLDLGSAPVMNKTTISRNVTVDLHNRAKKGEHDWAVDSAATMVDDVLSCAQLEFLGSGTRRFHNNRNPADPRNNKICTVPVRFDFKNKEQRIRAENTLRKVCNIRTAVPYPKKVREALAEIVEQGKKKSPGKFVLTKIDIENLVINAFVRGESGWIDLDLKRDISTLLIDTSAVVLTGNNEIEEIEIS